MTIAQEREKGVGNPPSARGGARVRNVRRVATIVEDDTPNSNDMRKRPKGVVSGSAGNTQKPEPCETSERHRTHIREKAGTMEAFEEPQGNFIMKLPPDEHEMWTVTAVVVAPDWSIAMVRCEDNDEIMQLPSKKVGSHLVSRKGVVLALMSHYFPRMNWTGARLTPVGTIRQESSVPVINEVYIVFLPSSTAGEKKFTDMAVLAAMAEDKWLQSEVTLQLDLAFDWARNWGANFAPQAGYPPCPWGGKLMSHLEGTRRWGAKWADTSCTSHDWVVTVHDEQARLWQYTGVEERRLTFLEIDRPANCARRHYTLRSHRNGKPYSR